MDIISSIIYTRLGLGDQKLELSFMVYIGISLNWTGEDLDFSDDI